MFVVVPLPVLVPPGSLVRVQVPEDGSPLRGTLPVPTLQLGWVRVPTTGALGVTGWVLITADPEALEIHPAALVTVQV